MCCIIHRPKDAKEISEENLKKVIDKNPHGWGVSFINNDGKLEVIKSMDMKEASNMVRELEKENKEFLFHVRWATHGEKTVDNCHPFKVYKGVMFHNGRMKTDEWRKEMSDTWHFSHKVYKFQKRRESLDEIIEERCKDIVTESRLAFMLEDGTVHKYGKWHDIDGCEYSKLDWQRSYNFYSGYDYGYGYGRNSNRGYVNRDYDDDYNYKNTIKKPSSELLDQIMISVSQGIVLEKHIESLSVMEIQSLIESYPETMANYLYKLVQDEAEMEKAEAAR